MEVTYIGPKKTVGGIPILSQGAADEVLSRYGLDIIGFWGLVESTRNSHHQLIVCDYTRIPGFSNVYSCAIYDMNTDQLVQRFNVRS